MKAMYFKALETNNKLLLLASLVVDHHHHHHHHHYNPFILAAPCGTSGLGSKIVLLCAHSTQLLFKRKIHLCLL